MNHKIGITGWGSYLPRLRMSRKSIAQANAWFAPGLMGKAKGTRTLANWDEDSITMSVAAARNALGSGDDRSHIGALYLASSTLPFAERLNAGVVSGALTLDDTIEALDFTGSQSTALSALSLALSRQSAGTTLVVAADSRKTRAASSQELDYGDGAAAVLVGSDNIVAELLGKATLTEDFVDHFRLAGEDIDYVWEERWVRDEGLSKLLPRAIKSALAEANVKADAVAHFIFPSSFARMDAQIAKACGIRPEAVVGNLNEQIGDTGIGHGLLLLASVLERAAPGEVIVLAQFGSGATALVLRTTPAISSFKPQRSVAAQLASGVEESNYTRMLFYKGQLELERGMRGEQDKKTALTTQHRHRKALAGLVAGRCSMTGQVHFPPSRISYTQGAPAQDTQQPYKLAERLATVLSWSAEALSFHMAPPHHYGQCDFDGGGRILMEFTDIRPGEVETGTRMAMSFRIKDFDDVRGFKRYFWKATPVNGAN